MVCDSGGRFCTFISLKDFLLLLFAAALWAAAVVMDFLFIGSEGFKFGNLGGSTSCFVVDFLLFLISIELLLFLRLVMDVIIIGA